MIITNDTFQRGLDLLRRWSLVLVVLLVLGLTAILGWIASANILMLLLALIGGALLLRRPILGLFVLVPGALAVPIEFATGTDVKLNLAALLVPVLLLIWLANMIGRRRLHVARSRVLLPLTLFLVAGLLSLLVGNVLWDPMVPRSNSFIIVQLAQWAIFAFSAGIFWLMGSLPQNLTQLRQLTFFALVVAGCIAVLQVIPVTSALMQGFVTVALIRAPFWLWLSALAGGLLLFDSKLNSQWRLFLTVILISVLVYTFVQAQESVSNWVGAGAVAGMLVWLRWPRLRWPIVALAVSGIMFGLLFPAVYAFAGGDAEWRLSGGSRLALGTRVIELTMRNPITGLGPAAYRSYGFNQPLFYQGAYWVNPRISSHNNYIDLFSHTGLLGLGLFLWFMAEVGWLGWRLHRRFYEGFASAYVNAMLATWVGTLMVMLLADWILPFVYNIGFPGFQASVLVWMFLGGLVALDNMPDTAGTEQEQH